MSFKSVLITGGNRGIGLGFVEQLLANTTSAPKHLIATTRQASNPQLDALRAKHPNLHVLQLESTDYKSFDGFAKEVAAIVGDDGLDTLINNSGIFLRNRLDDLTAESMITNFEVNSVSPLMLTKALLPLLKKAAINHSSLVLNISAVLGSCEEISNYQHLICYPYVTSKAALSMITKCLSLDLGPQGIRVVSIHPGHVQTDMGGPSGALTVTQSVSDMLNAVKKMSDTDCGKLLNYDGTVIPY